MSELAYSTKFVSPKIISIMDRCMKGSNTILKTRVIRSSKNKTKVLSEYEIPIKTTEKDNKEYLNKNALLKAANLFSKEFSHSVLS